MKRLNVLLSAFLVLSLLLVCCNGDTPTPAPEEPAEEPEEESEDEGDIVFSLLEENYLVIGLDGSFTSLDPQPELYDARAFWILKQCLLSPFELGASGDVYPAAASSYEVSSDYKEYTIHFDPNMFWSDGTPVSAEDYLNGMLRQLNPNRRARSAAALLHIVGARDYYEGLGSEEEVGLELMDEFTLRIRLEESFVEFPDVLTLPAAWPIHPDYYRADFDNLDISSDYPCNGPYRIESYEPEEHLWMLKNEQWPGIAELAVEGIVFRFIPDETELLEEYQAGNMEIAMISSQSATELINDPAWVNDVYTYRETGVEYLAFNPYGPFGYLEDASVRQALAMTIPRDRINDALLYNDTPYLPPWSMATDRYVRFLGEDMPTYMPDRARELFEEMGLGCGNDYSGTLTVLVPNWGDWPVVTEAIADAWWEELCIQVDYRHDWEEISYCEANPDDCEFDAIYGSAWAGSPDDWRGWTLLEQIEHNLDWWGVFDTQQYRDLLSLARAEPDEEIRQAYRAEAEGLLLQQEAFILPLMGYAGSLLFDSRTLSYEVYGSDKVKNPPPQGPPAENVRPKKITVGEFKQQIKDWYKYRTDEVLMYRTDLSGAISDFKLFVRDNGWECKGKIDTITTLATPFRTIFIQTNIPVAIAAAVVKIWSDEINTGYIGRMDTLIDTKNREIEKKFDNTLVEYDERKKDYLNQIGNSIEQGPDALTTLYNGLGNGGLSLPASRKSTAGRTQVFGALLYQFAICDKIQIGGTLDGSIYRLRTNDYWLCRGCSSLGAAVAKKLNDIKYYNYERDKVPPRHMRWLVWALYYPDYQFALQDRTSGISLIEFDWPADNNLADDYWWRFGDSRWQQADLNKKTFWINVDVATNEPLAPGTAEIWLYFSRKDSKNPLHFKMTVTDGVGNKKTYDIRWP